MTEKRLDIVINPARATSGGRVVKRQIKDIGDEAVKTQRRVGGMADKSGRSLDKFGRSAKTAGGAAAGLSGAATGTARSLGLTNIAAGVAATGFAGLAAAMAAAAVALGAVAVGASLTLDRALTEVATLSKNAKDNIGALKDEARAMAREFGGSAAGQVKAFYQAISAGAGTVKQAAVLLRDANRLAKAGVTDVLTGVNVLTTAVNAYGAGVLSTADASDAIFTAVKAGKTTVSELASGLGNVIPIASSLGVTFDELLGAVAALTTQGQSTSLAITGVRAILSTVAKPAQEASKMAKRLGIEFNTTALKSKGLRGFLKDVVTKTKGSKESLAQLFGSVEALNAVLAFSGGAGEKFTDVMDGMAKKAGATNTALKTVSESLSDRYDVALAKISDRLIDLGDRLLPLVVGALELLAKGVDFVATKFTNGMDRMEADATFAKEVISAAFTDIPSAISVGILAAVDFMVNTVKKALNGIIDPINVVLKAADYANKKFGGEGISQLKRFNDVGTIFGSYEGGELTKKAVSEYQNAVKKRQQAYTIIEMRGKKFGGLDETYSNRKSSSKKETEETGRNTRSLLGNSKARKTVISDHQKQRSAAKSATDGLRQETQSLRDQQTALGMGEQAATAFLKAKQVIAGLTRDGKTLLVGETKEIYEQAKGYAAQVASLKVVQGGIEAFKRSVEFAKGTTKSFISDFRQGMRNGEGFWKSFANAGLNALDKISDRLLDMAINNVFDNAFGGGGNKSGGGFLSSIFSAFSGGSKASADRWAGLRSFEGGGFTGHGSRTGGVDGRGGFLAINHPNETMIDHTKGFRMPSVPSPANNNQPQQVIVRVVASSEFDAMVESTSANVSAQIVRAASPAIINQAVAQGQKNAADGGLDGVMSGRYNSAAKTVAR